MREENEKLTGMCDAADAAVHDLAHLLGIETKGAVYGELVAEMPEIVRRLRDELERLCKVEAAGDELIASIRASDANTVRLDAALTAYDAAKKGGGRDDGDIVAGNEATNTTSIV